MHACKWILAKKSHDLESGASTRFYGARMFAQSRRINHKDVGFDNKSLWTLLSISLLHFRDNVSPCNLILPIHAY